MLTKLDKMICSLISSHMPPSYTGKGCGGDANAVLIEVLESSSSQFTIGLGVAYEPDRCSERGFCCVFDLSR